PLPPGEQTPPVGGVSPTHLPAPQSASLVHGGTTTHDRTALTRWLSWFESASTCSQTFSQSTLVKQKKFDGQRGNARQGQAKVHRGQLSHSGATSTRKRAHGSAMESGRASAAMGPASPSAPVDSLDRPHPSSAVERLAARNIKARRISSRTRC